MDAKGAEKGITDLTSEISNVSPFSLGAIILAAGRSSRMGRPKLLLPWGGRSIIEHLVRQWQESGAKQIAVVCAGGDATISGELDRLDFPVEQRIANPAREGGMFSSIQCAGKWRGWEPSLTHWSIILGDQPHLRIETLRKIIDFSAANPNKVCQPRNDGHRYHPVVLPRYYFEGLRSTSATNLRDFLGTCDSAYCEMNDVGLELDIDGPDDYEKALKVAGLPEKALPGFKRQ